VFSNSPLASWFDNVIREMNPRGGDFLYTRMDTLGLNDFETDRNFWQNMSQTTPVAVLVDEDAIEDTGRGVKAKWNSLYHQLLNKLYTLTNKFTIIKLNNGDFCAGAHAISKQAKFKPLANVKECGEKANAFAEKFTRLARNMPALGLQRQDEYANYLRCFLNLC
jgi:hypothetical protein